MDLQAAQALAAWLEHRPQLGHDVFARGQPELLGTAIETNHEVDVIEFLWACLALFDDDAEGSTPPPSICRPGAICIPSRTHGNASCGCWPRRRRGRRSRSFLPSAPPEQRGPGQGRAAATVRLEQHLRREPRADPVGGGRTAPGGQLR